MADKSPPAKKSRAEDILAGAESETDIEAILRTFASDIKEDVNKQLSTAMSAMDTAFVGKTTVLLRAHDEIQTRKLDNLQGQVDELKASVSKSESHHLEMQESIRIIQSALSIAEKTVVDAKTFDDEDFNKQPEFNKLRVGASEAVSRPAIYKTIAEWLANAGVADDQWNLVGGDLGKQFGVLFKGTEGLGARRARKANHCLKRDDGTWIQLETPTPAGGVAKLFIGPDESPKQLAEGRMGRRLVRDLRTMYPKRKFVFHKNQRVNGKNEKGEPVVRIEAVVKCDFKLLAKVEAKSYEDQQYFWIAQAVDEFKIDKAAVLEGATQGTFSAEWSL